LPEVDASVRFNCDPKGRSLHNLKAFLLNVSEALPVSRE